jgi:hypothetical protein
MLSKGEAFGFSGAHKELENNKPRKFGATSHKNLKQQHTRRGMWRLWQ